jgi:hypothetical protein
MAAKRKEQLALLDKEAESKAAQLTAIDRAQEVELLKGLQKKLTSDYQKHVDDSIAAGRQPMRIEEFKQATGYNDDIFVAQKAYEKSRALAERKGNVAGGKQGIRKKLDELDAEERRLLQGTAPEKTATTDLDVQTAEYGPTTAYIGTGKGPKETAMVNVEGGVADIGYVNRGDRPGMAGRVAGMIKDEPIDTIRSGNVINEETLAELARGYPARDTKIGRFRENIAESLGKNADTTLTTGSTEGKIGMETRLTGPTGPRQFTATPEELAKEGLDGPASMLAQTKVGMEIARKLRAGEQLSPEEMRIASQLVNAMNTNRVLPGSVGSRALNKFGPYVADAIGGSIGGSIGGAIGGPIGANIGGFAGLGAGGTIRRALNIKKEAPLPYRMPGEPDIPPVDTWFSKQAPKAGAALGAGATQGAVIGTTDLHLDDSTPTLRDILNQTDMDTRLQNKERDTQENIVTEDGIRYQILPDGTKVRIEE